MQRFFTFGCSFTEYKWPTWADILSLEYDYFENWALAGGGNHLIFYRLVECITRNKINAEDTVIIMWTSLAREDRWVNGNWLCEGTVYNSNYSKEFIDNFTDVDGYLIQNLCVMQAAKNILDAIGCNYTFLSIVPYTIFDDSWKKIQFKLKPSIEKKCTDVYSDVLSVIHPSVYEVIFNNDWTSRSNFDIPSATKQFDDEFRQAYDQCKGQDWPTFDYYVSDNLHGVKSEIINEIDNEFFLKNRKLYYNLQRKDFHPTPLEHLEYLKSINLITPTEKQRNFADRHDIIVRQQQNLKWRSKIPKNTL